MIRAGSIDTCSLRVDRGDGVPVDLFGCRVESVEVDMCSDGSATVYLALHSDKAEALRVGKFLGAATPGRIGGKSHPLFLNEILYARDSGPGQHFNCRSMLWPANSKEKTPMRYEPLTRPQPVPAEPDPEFVTTFYYDGTPGAEQYGISTNQPTAGGLLLDVAAYLVVLTGREAEAHAAGWLDHAAGLVFRLAKGKNSDPLAPYVTGGVPRPTDLDEPRMVPESCGCVDPRCVDGYVVDGVPAY